MPPREYRLSRPVYESLPWLYVACGVLALVVSWFQESRLISLLLGLFGFAAVLGGVVVLLRRRDFRELSASYTRGELPELGREEE